MTLRKERDPQERIPLRANIPEGGRSRGRSIAEAPTFQVASGW